MEDSLFISEKNTGLATTFLLDNGKFQLTGGIPKAEDSVRMLLLFISWFRIFLPAFVTDVLWLLQQPGDKSRQFKNVFRLQLLRAAVKFCPHAEIRTLDFSIFAGDRKNLYADIEFRHKLDKKSNFSQVRFLIA
jgi:hypothetical protein